MLTLLALTLAGCGGTLDPKVLGKREDVLPEEGLLRPDSGQRPSVFLPAPANVADWPEAGGSASHSDQHPALGNNIRQVWTADIGEGSGKRTALITPPIVAHGIVYAMDADSVISAYRLRDGVRLWKSDPAPAGADDPTYGGGLAYDQGALYATTGYGEVVRVEPATGKVTWHQTLPAPARGAPTVQSGRVLVITVENMTLALSTIDGAELWRHSGIGGTASLVGGNSPAVDGNTVVVAYTTGEIYSLRAENGSVLWNDTLSSLGRSDQISNMPDIRGLPVISQGRVFTAGNSGLIASYNLASGQRVWDRGASSIQTPWVAGNFIFLITNTPSVICIEAATGKVAWATRLPGFKDVQNQSDPVVWTGPLLASNRLVVASSGGTVLAISPYTGQTLGRILVPDGVEIAPIVANGSLIFLTDDAELLVYR